PATRIKSHLLGVIARLEPGHDSGDRRGATHQIATLVRDLARGQLPTARDTSIKRAFIVRTGEGFA
ncbi:MAG: hypothetical protein ABUL53_04415, partial [Bradyrhizobium guangdongense]